MGPNSQRKKSVPILNTPTRARFSTWTPPNKNKSSGRGGGRGGKRGYDDRDENKGNQPPIIDIKPKMNIDKVTLENQLPNGLELSRLESLVVDSSILSKLLTELNKTKYDLVTSDKLLLQIINEPIAKPLEIKIKSLSKPILIANSEEIKHKPVSLSSQSISLKKSNTNIKLTPAQKKAQNSYLQIGFTIEEITSALDLINASDIDEDEMYLALLLVTSKQDFNINKKNSNLISDHEKADCNQELKEEAQVLQSIYEDDISIRRISLLEVVCSVIDLNINFGNSNYNSSIRIIIYNSAEYPNIKSKVLIWFFNSQQYKSDDQFCRDISIGAMKEAELLMNNKVAFVFDIIQYIQTSITAKLESINDIVIVNKPNDKNNSNKNNYNDTNKIDKNNKNNLNGEPKQIDKYIKNKSKTLIKEPISSINYLEQKHIKEEKLTESTEYRQAFVRALNEGLLGQQARDSARRNLEYIFSSDKIARIKKEEDKIEAIRNKSCSFNKLGTGGEIEALKLLSQQTSLTKVRSKSLLGMAKSTMISEGRIYARDEASMISNWVTEAKDIYIKRLEAAELKANEKKEKRKPTRGLTIRDARKKRDASLIEEEDAAADDDSDEEENNEENNENVNKDNEFEISTGPFTAEHCTALAAMKMHAKLRTNGNTGDDSSNDELKRVQIEQLASRRLLNELEEKKKTLKYQDMLELRSSLPACQMSGQIVSTIKKNRVVVICGATGCGKTTQIPQLVFDDAIMEGIGGQMNMIITQPRRISAISVAERISEERIEKVGQTAGFHIRLESKRSMKTRLLLVTTGVLLRRLQLEEDLEGVSHIFVDEVHERDIQTDFLLIVLKSLMKRRPQLKVVCMSATLNAKMFADYFNDEGCALISIPGRAFPVTSFFLEDAIQQIGFKINAQSDCIYKTSMAARNDATIKKIELANREKRWKTIQTKLKANCSTETMNCLEIIDESILNTQLIIQLILHIALHCAEGAILIFVSGISDIRNLIDDIRICRELNDLPTKIFPLHSSLSSQEQSKVFQTYSKGIRKIVVTTNIAETSITIPDVVYVIDSGRVKENRFDEKTQLSILEETWISKANAQQRKGRAGRVAPGICYNLATSVTFDSFSDYTVPEMLRLSLEDIILQVLALDLGDPYDFLALAISPPERKSIKNALLFLDNLNAVNVEETFKKPQLIGGGNDSSYNSVITPLGYHLASLPLSPRIGKLIIYGLVLGCINPILSIAAIVSAKSPFLMPFDPSEREQADLAKERFLEGNSDLLTMLNAYKDWKKIKETEKNKKNYGKSASDDFCDKNYLSVHSMSLIDQMRLQFLTLLKDIGFISFDINIENIETCFENKNGHEINMIKCVLAAGLSPNILQIPASAKGKKISEGALVSKTKGTSVFVHPSSVLSEAKTFDSSYLIYLEAIMTSKVYARDITTVNPLVLALFASKLTLFQNIGVIVIDNWIGFKVSTSLIQVLLLLRQELEEAFVEKVVDPSSDNNDKLKRVLCMIELFVLQDIKNFKIPSPQPPIDIESISDLPPNPPEIDQSLSNLYIAKEDLDDDKSINFISNETICNKNETTWECEKCSYINVSSHTRCLKCLFVIKIEINTPFNNNKKYNSSNNITLSDRGENGMNSKDNNNKDNTNNHNNKANRGRGRGRGRGGN